MNSQQQKEALRIARRVRSGELTRAAGVLLLNERIEVTSGSASIVIDNYLALSDGRVFKRTFSATDLDFFVGAIAEEEGAGQLEKALSALRLHIAYRVEENYVNPVKFRAILAKYEDAFLAMTEAGNNAIPVFLGDLESSFNELVNKAKNNSQEERRSQLSRANKRPRKVSRLIYVFERNPDVVVEVLNRARGHCEGCNARAPFTRKSNQTPYLEVHHKVPLAEDGEDSVENAIALCPNCHRQRHFG